MKKVLYKTEYCKVAVLGDGNFFSDVYLNILKKQKIIINFIGKKYMII